MKKTSNNLNTLSPKEVSQKFLTSELLIQKVEEAFNIFKLENVRESIVFPHPPFKNTAHGFILLTEGSMQMLLNQEKFTFSSATFILTPAGQMNNFISIAPNSKGFIGTFDAPLLSFDKQQNTIATFGKMLSSEQLPHFRLDTPEVELIYPIMQRIWQLHHSNHPHKLLLIPNYLCNVLLELQALYFANAPVTKSKPEELVANFKKLLLAEIYNSPKPSDLAKMLHVSTNHLNKVLNKLTKKTTSKWIAEQRIMEAKYLLSYSTSSISEVAYRLGFSQPAHFTNFFKSQTGILPTEYQKD